MGHGRWRAWSAVVVVAMSLPAMGQMAGQTSAGKGPAYDVATIKLNNSGDNGTRVWIEGPTYTATNIPLKRLLEGAYDIKTDLIFGVPDALGGKCFDVTAKMLDADPEALKKLRDKDKQELLLPVLVERFHLKAHKETRTLPVYELVTMPGGPKDEAGGGRWRRDDPHEWAGDGFEGHVYGQDGESAGGRCASDGDR